MSKQKNGAAANGTTPTSKVSASKVTAFPRHLQDVLEIISDGKQYTARSINILTGRNDARKAVSELIRLGVPIVKRLATGQRRKWYWLSTQNKTYKQTELFSNNNYQGASKNVQNQAIKQPQHVGDIIAGEWVAAFMGRVAEEGGKYEK